MKLLNLSRADGYARIEIENKDDIWYLKDLITPGSKVSSLTKRTKRDGREKKTLTLSLEVEKVDYQGNRLRVTGEIIQGDEDIELGYHTFNLEDGKEFEIWKDWSDDEWSRLKEAERKRSYQVLFCVMEKGKADFYLVEESGISSLSKLDVNIPGKMYMSDEGTDFYNQVKSIIKRSIEEVDNLVLCGPGHEKEKMFVELSEEVQEKTLVQDTSVTGITGLNEAIKRGALDQVVEESRISKETEALEELFERLEKDEKVSYGEEVRELAEIGAVEKLLITAEEHRDDPDLAKKVEEKGGESILVHTDHEAGERLEKLGGIGALLRYEV